RSGARMTDGVERELFELDDSGAEAVARLPPAVRIEARVPRVADGHARRAILHRPMEHAADAARMIRHAHHDDRAELPLGDPRRQHAAFVVGAADPSGNALDGVNAEA